MALLLLPCLSSWAQTYSFRNYTQADGLLGMAIHSLYEDREGVIWAGTELGLHRFERGRFDLVGSDEGVGSSYIHAITEDAKGRLWIGTANGIYVRERSTFVPVLHEGRQIPTDPGNTLTRFADGIAVVSRMRLLTITSTADTNRWQIDALPLQFADGGAANIGNAVLFDGQWLWSNCGDYLCRSDLSGNTTRYGAQQGLPNVQWQALFQDSNGTLWLRGGQHVLSLPAGSSQFTAHPLPADINLASFTPTSLVQDQQGRILTPVDNGLLRCRDGVWQVFHRRPGMNITPLAGSLLIDRSGDLWVGTRGLGIQRWIGYGRIAHWDESQGLAAAPVWSILRSADGKLLVGSHADSSSLAPAAQKLQPWTLADGSPLRQVSSQAIAPDKAVWLSYASGRIARRDPHDQLTRDVTKVPGHARRLLFDATGRLWIFTSNGVHQLAPGAVHTTTTSELPNSSYTDAVRDPFGRLWATSHAGVFLYAGRHWQQVQLEGTPRNNKLLLLSVAMDGEVWFSLNDVGLWRGRLDDNNVLRAQKVDDPLLSRTVPYAVQHDRNGWLWVGSSQGIDLYRNGRWSRLTQTEGLLGDDISSSALFEDDDGSMWIGSSRGLTRLSEPNRLFAPAGLDVRIVRVRRKLQPISPGQGLLWSDSPLDFEYATPGANGSNNRISFRYRIKGYHSDWIHTEQSRLSYTFPSAGRYVFEVQAVDNRQRSRSNAAVFAFEIFPPWWRSPFALLTYVLGSIAMVVYLQRLRMRRLLKHEQVLHRLVAERTGELEREKRELEAVRAELTIKATRDDLTGLLNRTGILQAMTTDMQACEHSTAALAIMLIDLDHFKKINDLYGHLTGDSILAQVGQRLNTSLRDSDKIGRYGGEELLAVMPGLTKNALYRLHSFHDTICKSIYKVGQHELKVTCSIGVAWYRPGEDGEQLLSRADLALYRAKDNGRNRIELEPS